MPFSEKGHDRGDEEEKNQRIGGEIQRIEERT
jgi:hypothetical protein